MRIAFKSAGLVAAAAAVEQARANVTNARLNLGYTTITSPVAGSVTSNVAPESAPTHWPST